MKACSKCRENKSLDEFSEHPGTKDGKQSQCKMCQKLTNKRWRKSPAGRRYFEQQARARV